MKLPLVIMTVFLSVSTLAACESAQIKSDFRGKIEIFEQLCTAAGKISSSDKKLLENTNQFNYIAREFDNEVAKLTTEEKEQLVDWLTAENGDGYMNEGGIIDIRSCPNVDL